MPKKDEKILVKGKIWVSRMHNGEEVHDEKELEVQQFEVEPAYVKASYGLTLNLGNYESARCDAGVTLPTYVEEIDDAFKRAWKIAQEEVQSQVKEIRG